ncbi:exported protein of unknown function [Magnetospirillum sp. XM-1]|nr:hypothetical protein [Magnetospirillum sp. XM-1]CUW38097.1 exported protein of unknown function [Magnetospirillum sp. XM-1]
MKTLRLSPALSLAWLMVKLVVGVLLAVNLGEAVVIAYQQF